MTMQDKDTDIEKPLTSVMEDYLEAIFDLNTEKRVVRVKDIARRMDVKMPTVSSMLKSLNEKGMVNYEKYEYVELTRDGETVGKEIRRRHEVIFKFLTEILQIDRETADEEACKMEHALSAPTLESLTDFMEFIQACPRTGENWLAHFVEYRQHGCKPENCRSKSVDFACKLKKRAKSMKGSDS